MKQLTKKFLLLGVLVTLLLIPMSAHAQTGGQVTLEQVNKAIAELEKIAQKEIDDGAVAGLAIAVVFQDKVVYAQGFGVREVGKPEKINADTVFQLASVSKPIGSTVVAALVGDGKISWDSKISDLDPTFEMYDPWVTREITIRDFYAHRSGLPPHIGDLLEDLGYDRAQVLHRLRFQSPLYSFRTRETYTNFGLTEAGIAAAKAYGLEWEVASEEKLYKPLGMTSTSSTFKDFMVRTNRAAGHVLVDGKWVHKIQRQPDAQSPAGGVSSSVNDMTKWMRLQIGNGKFEGKPIVPEEPLVTTHQPQILTGFSPLTGLPGFAGLGWNVGYDAQGRLRLGHSGGFALGAGTQVTLVPAEQLGIVTLSNSSANGVPEGLNQIFMDTALYGKPQQDWLPLYKKIFSDPATLGVIVGFDYSKPPASPTPALKNAAYLGTFANAFYGEISIIEKDGALAIVLPPNKTTLPMKHYDRDIFTFETFGENAVGTTGVFFSVGADGKTERIRVEYLDEFDNGTFERVADSK